MAARSVIYVCAFCCVLILITIIVLIVLASKTYTPKSSIHDMYIPALDTRSPILNSSALTPTFIFFDLQLQNRIKSANVRFNYANLTLAFFYGRNPGIPIANYTLPRFDQGGDDATHLRDVVEARGMPWSDASALVSQGSGAAFTVELVARVKVKRDVGHSGVKTLLVRGTVVINNSGERFRNKAVKLVASA